MLGLLLPGGVRAEEETGAVEEEPVLEGAALKAHKKAVKAVVKELHRERNREVVRNRIGRMGTTAGRVNRDALIAFATGNKNQEFVKHAFDALAKIGGKPSIEFLTGKHALRAKAFLVQQSAAIALGEAKDERATPALLEVMTNRRSKIEVISACAIALGKSAPTDERVVEELFKLSKHRKDTIRSNGLEALGYLATDEAVAVLTEALASEKNARARAAAATGLGHSMRMDVVETLEAAVKDDKSLHVRNAASDAIREIHGEE